MASNGKERTMAEDDKKRDVLRELTPEIVDEAAGLLAKSGYGALATLAPGDGWPQASRVALAWVDRFVPLILVSGLAAHTGALRAEPRCSLLVGEVGKGDPLAHPRLMLKCRAAEIARGGPDYAGARTAYLEAQPKAQLYIDLPDFALMALRPESITFNAGFGRAYLIDSAALG
jgi:heme iron utilization protein